MRRVFAYLTKIACFYKEVVQFFVDEQMLYQDVYGNCVFVGYDDSKAPVYGFLRGTIQKENTLETAWEVIMNMDFISR